MRRLKTLKKHKKAIILYIVLILIIILLNIVAWNSTTFCDAYIKYVFPIWVNTYGRITGIFPFSVGEILLVLGVVSVVLFGVLLLIFAVVKLGVGFCRFKANKKSLPVPKAAEDNSGSEKGFCQGKYANCFFKISKGYFVWFTWLLLAVCLIMTLNCTILYHASTFSENYFGEAKDDYSLEELIEVRNMVVEKCNALSQEMERDAEGNILYTEDIEKGAIKAMQKLGQTYHQLDGYYPRPKPLAASDFFSQQYMAGYYFPFSMEANYNNVMYIMNKPASMCHELAHLRGYIYEDEANFISYLACIQSGDKFLEYSGYLSVLNYLDNDFYDAVGRDREAYMAQPVILSQVHVDNQFLTDEEWDRINGKAVIDTETVDEISDTFTETVLVANGVSDGMISYSRVVKLLLQYYSKTVQS